MSTACLCGRAIGTGKRGMADGEAPGTGAPASNLRGQPYQRYDGAGVVTSVAFDFKGNPRESKRRVALAYAATVDWIALDALTDPTAIASAASSALETETFATTTAYDALNRPTSITTPDASEIRPGYNEAGLLEKVDVRVHDAASWTAFVADIDYDAKGQREQIVYGANATTTEYAYDPLTFRMTQIKTTRASDDAVLQNLQYTYDPVGNITEIKDSAQQAVFFNDDVVLPVMAYTYDALYRLTQATGRELTAIASFAPDLDDVPVSLPHANNMNAVRNYTQEYAYDAVGNILQMVHKIGATPEWTRHYKYETGAGSNPISNRLLATSAFADEGDFSATYGYDEHGNMVSMPHLSTVAWNHRDEMASADLGGGGVVYFTYDSAGQRVRKVYEHSGLVEERIYLGGFEVYRKRVASTGVVTVERETLHVMDGVQRIALVETKTVDTAAGGSFTPETATRLQLGNHLGSAALEVDLTGAVISYEEYHPYGTTAYEAASGAVEVSRKRYRYTGKERDEETGLYYHGARYYAPWLGRWNSADPSGLRDGPNLYLFVLGNPVRMRDPDGRQAEDAEQRPAALDPQQIKRIGEAFTQSRRLARGLPELADVARHLFTLGARPRTNALIQRTVSSSNEGGRTVKHVVGLILRGGSPAEGGSTGRAKPLPNEKEPTSYRAVIKLYPNTVRKDDPLHELLHAYIKTQQVNPGAGGDLYERYRDQMRASGSFAAVFSSKEVYAQVAALREAIGNLAGVYEKLVPGAGAQIRSEAAAAMEFFIQERFVHRELERLGGAKFDPARFARNYAAAQAGKFDRALSDADYQNPFRVIGGKVDDHLIKVRDKAVLNLQKAVMSWDKEMTASGK